MVFPFFLSDVINGVVKPNFFCFTSRSPAPQTPPPLPIVLHLSQVASAYEQIIWLTKGSEKIKPEKKEEKSFHNVK